jgi:hypothetical protein
LPLELKRTAFTVQQERQMKRQNKKLMLSKEVVRNLTDTELERVVGGASNLCKHPTGG